MRRRNGFTLLELLIVVGIIAILVSLLMPVLWKIQESGRATKCLGNLRHLGTAIVAYTRDYEDRLPPRMIMKADGTPYISDSMIGWVGKTGRSITWPNGVTNNYAPIIAGRRYLNSYLGVKRVVGNNGQEDEVPAAACPSDEAMRNFSNMRCYDGYGTSYITNGSHANTNEPTTTHNPSGGKAGLPMSAIKNPQRFVVMVELSALLDFPEVVTMWHLDGRHGMVFADGHADRHYVTAEEIANHCAKDLSWAYWYTK